MDKQSLTRLQRQLTGKYVATNGLFWMAYVCIWGFGAVYLKGKGFNIFCNVDSSKCWVQFGSNYMRQGRRNLDGYRMYYNPELVSDLFDVSSVWDNARPTPVPQM